MILGKSADGLTIALPIATYSWKFGKNKMIVLPGFEVKGIVQSFSSLFPSSWKLGFCSRWPWSKMHLIWPTESAGIELKVSVSRLQRLYCRVMVAAPHIVYMVCNTWKGTFGRLLKVSFQISLRSPHRLIWNDTFCFMYLFCLQQIYCSTKSNGVVKCRLGLACADSAGWSETTLYANVRKSLFPYCKPYGDMSKYHDSSIHEKGYQPKKKMWTTCLFVGSATVITFFVVLKFEFLQRNRSWILSSLTQRTMTFATSSTRLNCFTIYVTIPCLNDPNIKYFWKFSGE